ncbi:MAG: acyloxyacyl hydrolase [Pseudomonadota bacterium]
MKMTLCAASLCLVTVSVAEAQSLIASAGFIDFSLEKAEDAAVFELEYVAAPSWSLFDFETGWNVLGRFDSEDGAYIGAGLLGKRDFAEDWFVELSLMPGYYDEGRPENDLGHEIEFRSMAGIGRTIGEGRAVSLAVSHISNARLSSVNPGANAVHLRFHFDF